MGHFERFLFALAVIFFSMASGILFKKIWDKKGLPDQPLAVIRKRLQSAAIFFLLPLSAMLSLWGLPKPSKELLFLPCLGLISYIMGGFLALVSAKILKLSKVQTGSYYCCGTFTNIGAVGGLVCLLFLGENSIALVALYRLLEEIYYFGISFPAAARFSIKKTSDKKQKLSKLQVHPVLFIIVFALLSGIYLNYAEYHRPLFLGMAASVSMFFSSVFFLFAIGLTLKLSSVGIYWKEGLLMCVIKFFALPAIVTSAAFLFGLGIIENGLPLKTVFILSSMPVAMTALVPPSLFELDIHLANACWIITTSCLIFILPLLMFLLPKI